MSIWRKLHRMLEKAKEALFEYAYLITLGTVVAIVAASAMYTRDLQERSRQQVQAAADAPEIQETLLPEETIRAEVTPLPTIAPMTLHSVSLLTGGGRVWPVSGNVIRAYEPDKLILWEALACYQVHMGVDIAAKAGETVLCAADGVVERVVRDDLWGWSIRIAQTDGRTTLYAGLESCLLTAGDAVARGEALGTLLETIPCEAELGTHLHMELEWEGKEEDPLLMLENAKRSMGTIER